jgi:hypothetical protein
MPSIQIIQNLDESQKGNILIIYFYYNTTFNIC